MTNEFWAGPPKPEPRDEQTERVIGAMIAVHEELGPGLSETLYEQALCHELDLRGIRYQRQVLIPVLYKGVRIGETRIDLIVEDSLIIELKAVETLTNIHRAQVITYLRITGIQKALLVNFNVAVLKEGIKRIVLTHD